MTDSETQNSIVQWSKATFGECKNINRMAVRLNSELAELLAHISLEEWKKARDECADVYIVLVSLVNILGDDLHYRVDQKMRINRARKWQSFGDGTGQHIKK